MIDIINEQTLSDPLLIGIANTLLIEVAKRVPQIPLDPKNPEQVRLVSGGLLLVLSIGLLAVNGQLNAGSLQETIRAVVQLWLTSWIVSHTAYQAIPGMKQKTEPAEPVAPTE